MRKWIAVAVLACCAHVARGQVSDPQAYFQWMLAITDDTLTPRMAAHLSAAGLNGDEAEKAARILSQFKAEEFGLEASYNNLPSVQAGRNDDTAAFLDRQDALIHRTLSKLRIALSTTSMTRLDNRVEHEAKNIKVSATHRHSQLTPVSFGRPQRLGMTPNYTYYTTTASSLITAPLSASMLNNNGFDQWNASNLIDGDNSTVGFATTPGSGAWVGVDFGYGNAADINELGIYMSAAGSTAQFQVGYSDGNGGVNVVPGSGGSNFTPVDAGWNYTAWPDIGAHRFWSLQLVNTPGAGPTINELQLVEPGLTHYTTSQVTGTTSCPDGCPPLAKHVGWAQVVIGSAVHNTFGPQVYPTGYINVSDSESTVLPVGGPPVNVSTTGGVNCTVAGNGFSGTPSINNEIIFAVTYSENLNVNCGTIAGLQCTEIIDYCTPPSTPPDFDPTQAVGSVPIIRSPFFIGHSDCDRPFGSAPGTLWQCLWPTPPGYTLPRGTPVRRTCTNTDKGTKGDWPGPW